MLSSILPANTHVLRGILVVVRVKLFKKRQKSHQ